MKIINILLKLYIDYIQYIIYNLYTEQMFYREEGAIWEI